jgi:hypothetical protein
MAAPRVVEFAEPTLEWQNHPFPPAIAQDPYVLYHGTSSIHEAEIDRDGLRPSHPQFQREEVAAVARLFQLLSWRGRSAASRAVLEPFSLQHDFSEDKGRAVHFGEGVLCAIQYSAARNAGGEVANALRCSFDDLWAYATDESIRADHRVHIAECVSRLGSLNAHPDSYPQPPSIGVEQLVSELGRLEPLRRSARSCERDFTHGVVYAVRFSVDDLPLLEHDSFMGTRCYGPIPPHRLLAKMHVPRAYELDRCLRGTCRLGLPAEGGILNDLRSGR